MSGKLPTSESRLAKFTISRAIGTRTMRSGVVKFWRRGCRTNLCTCSVASDWRWRIPAFGNPAAMLHSYALPFQMQLLHAAHRPPNSASSHPSRSPTVAYGYGGAPRLAVNPRFPPKAPKHIKFFSIVVLAKEFQSNPIVHKLM